MSKPERMRRKYWLYLFAFALLAVNIDAQRQPSLQLKNEGGSAEVVTLKLESKLMGREMPYRIVMPRDYKAAPESRFAVIYLLHGLTGHYNNWTDKTALAQYALRHKFIIVTPEGDNGWYTDGLSVPNAKYESYIVRELIPEIDKRFRTHADRTHRMIAGLSMGGYGGIKFGIKYPELFSVAGSFSGALGAAAYTEKIPGEAGRSIAAIFGPEDSAIRKSNDIFGLIREMSPAKIKELPFIYQSCGTEDFLIGSNRDFLALLNEKRVSHEYREHPGGHTWSFWDDQIREFLDVAGRSLKK